MWNRPHAPSPLRNEINPDDISSSDESARPRPSDAPSPTSRKLADDSVNKKEHVQGSKTQQSRVQHDISSEQTQEEASPDDPDNDQPVRYVFLESDEEDPGEDEDEDTNDVNAAEDGEDRDNGQGVVQSVETGEQQTVDARSDDVNEGHGDVGEQAGAAVSPRRRSREDDDEEPGRGRRRRRLDPTVGS